MKTQDTSKATAGVRYDPRTGQFIPTINGRDTSPTAFDESRALQIAESQIFRAVNEYDALCAVAEAARALLAHHRISELRKLHSDTLDPRFEALDSALAAIRNR